MGPYKIGVSLVGSWAYKLIDLIMGEEDAMNVKGATLGLVMFLTMAVGVSSEMWYTQTFDDLKDGPLQGQDDWIGAATIQNKLFHGKSGQSINVTGKISRGLPEHADIQYVTFYFMVTEKANMDWKLYMANAAETQAAAMGLNPNNETLHIHGGDEQMPVDVQPEQWYQLGAVLDFDSKTWKLYFNDMENPFREGKGFRDASADALVNIWLTIWTPPSAGGLYVDDFMIGDGDVIPTALDSAQAVNPATKLATSWGKVKAEL
jgi:hypothetical protein